jgi:hypothetical protein
MQSERTAEASALSGSVRGLGVCDALRLELLPEQLPQLIEQVEALRRSSDGYELHLANLLYDALPAPETSSPFACIGPTHIMRDIVRSSLHAAAAALAEALSTGSSERLAAAAACAAAWTRTYLECRAIEEFSFDPDADPLCP